MKKVTTEEPKELVKDREDRAALYAQREQERLDKLEADKLFAAEMEKERLKLEEKLAEKASKISAKYYKPKQTTIKMGKDSNKDLISMDYASGDAPEGAARWRSGAR